MLGNLYQNHYPMKKMITHTEVQMWNRIKHREAKRRRPVQKVQIVVEKNGELHHVCTYRAAARILGTSSNNLHFKLRESEYTGCYLNNCKVLVG